MWLGLAEMTPSTRMPLRVTSDGLMGRGAVIGPLPDDEVLAALGHHLEAFLEG